MSNCPVKTRTPKNIPNPCIKAVIFFIVQELYPINKGVCFLICLKFLIIRYMAPLMNIPAKKTPVLAKG